MVPLLLLSNFYFVCMRLILFKSHTLSVWCCFYDFPLCYLPLHLYFPGKNRRKGTCEKTSSVDTAVHMSLSLYCIFWLLLF